MKKWTLLAASALLLLAVACSRYPADTRTLGDAVVITSGVPTTQYRSTDLASQADLDAVVLEGSVSEYPLQVCEGGASEIDVRYRLSGGLNFDTDIEIADGWTYDGSDFYKTGSTSVLSFEKNTGPGPKPDQEEIVRVTVGADAGTAEAFPTLVFAPEEEVSGVDYEGDGFSATAEIDVHVMACGDATVMSLLPPIKSDGSSVFKQGSVVPIKFHSGDWGTEMAPQLALTLYWLGSAEESPGDVTSPDAPGATVWRYDADDDQYVFNLKTTDVGPGHWEAVVTFAGEDVATGRFSIR